jgi:hypothetical protein
MPMATVRGSFSNDSAGAGGVPTPRVGMAVWFGGIPYRLREKVIGATWSADEIFGRRTIYLLTTKCHQCRLHGLSR